MNGARFYTEIYTVIGLYRAIMLVNLFKFYFHTERVHGLKKLQEPGNRFLQGL